jgi:hypothetical protein
MADGGEEVSESTSKEEPFQTVRTRSKRKLDRDEDMEKGNSKSRPSFPPVKAQKLSVSFGKISAFSTHVVLNLPRNTNAILISIRIKTTRFKGLFQSGC